MKSKNTMYYIKSIIGLVIMFGFGLLPPIEPLTPLGMRILGLFVGLIFLLCAVDIVWPSMVGMVGLGLTGYCSVGEAITNGFGSEMVWMMMILLVLAAGISNSGLGEIMARWFITRKALQSRPMLFTFVYMVAFGLCSLLVASFTSVILAWSIFYSIADMVGYKKGERYSTIFIIGCFLSCIMYEGLFAFQSWWLVLASTFKDMTGYHINYLTYFVISFTIVTIVVLLLVLSMKYVFKCDFDKIAQVDVSKLKNDEMKLNFRHKVLFTCFGLIVIYAFVTIALPADWPIIAFLNSISLGGWFALVLCVAMVVKWKDEPILDFPSMAAEGINWNIIMMCAALIPIAKAVTADGTGVKDLLSYILSPMLSNMHPVLFIITIIIIMMVLTNIGSNMATGIVLMTVVIPFVQDYYFSPALIGMIIIFIATMGFILPGSSGMAPYLYANKWIEVKDIYKYGLYWCLLFFLVSVPVYLIASFIV